MKLAEDWAPLDPMCCMDSDCTEAQHLTFIRQIQADSLRYAAGLSGELHRVHLLALADELETHGYSVPTPKP